MIKQILKEIIIILLLIVAILLILSVLFYDYNPSNKVVPNKVAYSVDDNIRRELEEANQKNETTGIEGKVYTVEGADLNIYKKSNTYNPSKQNPYANSTAGSSTTIPQNDNNGTSKDSNSKNTTNTINNNTATSNQNTNNGGSTTSRKTGLK